jgi:2-phosphosulfolactate phosphatase
MRASGVVVIDCFPDAASRYLDGWAIVAIDVIRATTVATTAAAQGRRCFPKTSTEAALRLAGRLGNALLAGELGGDKPAGFEMNNSPAELAARTDVRRPLVLVSTSGTQLIVNGLASEAVYLACFRNFGSVARYLVDYYSRVAVIGAGSRNEFREEDQMCCAWVAQSLLEAGYRAQNEATVRVVERWRNAPPDACLEGHSAAYLRRTGQTRDLDFVLTHINDLDAAFVMRGSEVLMVPAVAYDAVMENWNKPARRESLVA